MHTRGPCAVHCTAIETDKGQTEKHDAVPNQGRLERPHQQGATQLLSCMVLSNGSRAYIYTLFEAVSE
jgi:hypothetical protein